MYACSLILQNILQISARAQNQRVPFCTFDCMCFVVKYSCVWFITCNLAFVWIHVFVPAKYMYCIHLQRLEVANGEQGGNGPSSTGCSVILSRLTQ